MRRIQWPCHQSRLSTELLASTNIPTPPSTSVPAWPPSTSGETAVIREKLDPPIPCHPNPKLPRPISFSFTYSSFLSDPVSPGYIFILFKVMPPETLFYKADLLEMVTLQGWEPAKQCVRVNRVLWLSLIILTQHSCDDQTQIVCVHVCERVWMTEREVKNVRSWKAVNL